MLKLIGAALKSGTMTEWVALVLGVLMVMGAVYGAGYAGGSSMCVTAQAKVTAAAVPHATAAQAAQDDKDYRRGVEDGKELERRARAAGDAAAELKARSHAAASANPPKPNCPPQVIPAALMDGLNDPKLIGGGQ
jgi:hypothetical protein